ncbi:MAG: DUF5668 domain-containing protein [Bacteroidales bacterium]|nr:DUF5668 domain-containing protein [Bacteroidales bacterium]
MKYKNLFWGIVLILLGVLYLLKSMDLIWFNWKDILSLWPILLVLWGISLLPVKSIYKLIASLLAILIMALLIYNHPGRWHSGWIWMGDFHKSDNTEMNRSESFNGQSEHAILELNAAAGTYTIGGTTNQLVDFTHIGDSGTYYMRTTMDEDKNHVYIGPESKISKYRLYRSHEVDIKLNPDLVWDMDIDAGAADISMDLSPYIIRDIEIDGGATSMEIKLGSRSDQVFIHIETGVSSVVIRVPEEIACEVNTDSFLVSKDLPGFDKVSKHTYVSPNFASSQKNITIHFESGISNFRVLRY